MDTNELATETPQAQRPGKNIERSALFPFSASVAPLRHKYCLVLCLAESLETLAVGLPISLNRFVFGRQEQPVGEAVHMQAALTQIFSILGQ